MPETTSYTSLELEDLSEKAPRWLFDLLEHVGELELEAEIYFGYGSAETRTDPADMGEMEFMLYYTVSSGGARGDIEQHWLTDRRMEQINEQFWDELNINAADDYAARGDYLYEQAKERKL